MPKVNEWQPGLCTIDLTQGLCSPPNLASSPSVSLFVFWIILSPTTKPFSCTNLLSHHFALLLALSGVFKHIGLTSLICRSGSLEHTSKHAALEHCLTHTPEGHSQSPLLQVTQWVRGRALVSYLPHPPSHGVSNLPLTFDL